MAGQDPKHAHDPHITDLRRLHSLKLWSCGQSPAHLILQNAAQVLLQQELESPLEQPICSHVAQQRSHARCWEPTASCTAHIRDESALRHHQVNDVLVLTC